MHLCLVQLLARQCASLQSPILQFNESEMVESRCTLPQFQTGDIMSDKDFLLGMLSSPPPFLWSSPAAIDKQRLWGSKASGSLLVRDTSSNCPGMIIHATVTCITTRLDGHASSAALVNRQQTYAAHSGPGIDRSYSHMNR